MVWPHLCTHGTLALGVSGDPSGIQKGQKCRMSTARRGWAGVEGPRGRWLRGKEARWKTGSQTVLGKGGRGPGREGPLCQGWARAAPGGVRTCAATSAPWRPPPWSCSAPRHCPASGSGGRWPGVRAAGTASAAWSRRSAGEVEPLFREDQRRGSRPLPTSGQSARGSDASGLEPVACIGGPDMGIFLFSLTTLWGAVIAVGVADRVACPPPSTVIPRGVGYLGREVAENQPAACSA